MSDDPTCARCGGPTVRLSALYMEALEALSAPRADLSEPLRALLGPEAASGAWIRIRALRRLLGLVGPPSGSRRVTRTLHPDVLAGGFALVVVVALVRAWREQPTLALASAAVCAAALLLYAATRGRILRRYARVRAGDEEAARAVEHAVARWMELRCCLRERLVDGAVGEPAIPLEALPQALVPRPPL
jgi:hypothetical protein